MQELLQSEVVQEWFRVLEGMLEERDRARVEREEREREERRYDEVSEETLEGGRESQGQRQSEEESRGASSAVVVQMPERVRTPMDVRTVDPRRRVLPNPETRSVQKSHEPGQYEGGSESRQEDGVVKSGEVEECKDGELEEGEILEEHGPGSVVAQRDVEADPVAKETNAYEEARSHQEQIKDDDDAHRNQNINAATGPQGDFSTS